MDPLQGSIPVEFYQFSQLEKLWLGNNRLSGTLLPEIAGLTSIQDLYG